MELWGKLNDTSKGLLLMVVGILLLFHTLGIVKKGLDLVIIIIAIAMIVDGFIRAGYHTKILLLIQRPR